MKRSIAGALRLLMLVASLAASVALAEIDLTGTWASRMHEDWMDRWPGPDLADFTGLPLNDDGRAAGLIYSSSQLSMPERQCLYYPPHYTEIGPFGLKLWPEEDRVTAEVIAWHISGAVDRSPRTIWMDGRPHPSENALHTFAGFSTGEWRGDTLVVRTTHMKAGPIRRNGVPASDQTVMTEHFTRHGDVLTVLVFIEDPVYLEAPHVLSRSWVLDEEASVAIYPSPCVPGIEAPGIGHGDVPHHLPDENPFIDDFANRYNLPREAALGGLETLFPEYREVLRENYTRPPECGRYCCGWVNDIEGGLECITEEGPARRN